VMITASWNVDGSIKSGMPFCHRATVERVVLSEVDPP